MVRRTWFPVRKPVSEQLLVLYFHSKSTIDNFRLICAYSTAATDEAAYVIGGTSGSNYSQTIAEFKNDQWRKVGDLTQGRCYHGSVSIGQKSMVVGGFTSNSA